LEWLDSFSRTVYFRVAFETEKNGMNFSTLGGKEGREKNSSNAGHLGAFICAKRVAGKTGGK